VSVVLYVIKNDVVVEHIHKCIQNWNALCYTSDLGMIALDLHTSSKSEKLVNFQNSTNHHHCNQNHLVLVVQIFHLVN
jgi:hypothetical protein